MRRAAWWLGGSAAALGGVVALAGGAGDAQRTAAAPPRARYYLDAATSTGMPSVNVGAMLFKRRMGAAPPQHELELRLGSTLSPTGGAAKADHFMPAGALLGTSVPLATPTPSATPAEQTREDVPQGVQRPRGRLLLFWGCGAHAGPGQPVVIDFARVSEGQFPPGLFTADVPVDRGPTPNTSRTFGRWPNALDEKKVDPRASLLGTHRVVGNYSPTIDFTLAQDFMPPLAVTPGGNADGSMTYAWSPVAGATGYYAWAVGARGSGDMVWWSSSARQAFGAGLWDYPSPSVVGRLIGQRLVMPPSQTSCQIPTEVTQASGPALMGFVYAYGPQVDIAYPPRPANPRTPWRPDWTVRARFRSTAMVMPSLGAMMRGADASDENDQHARRRKCKPSLGGLVGGMFGGKARAAAGAADAAIQAAECR